jgi:hypothetical protein
MRIHSGGAIRVPVKSGRNFRVDSPAANGLVSRVLAAELERVLEIFGSHAHSEGKGPIGVYFKPGIFGHHKVGRAADIYAVGGIGFEHWKSDWDAALRNCSQVINESKRRAILNEERRKNLGWQLYKALQTCGRWSQPSGFPIQLFGPWTRSEGPWHFISDFLLKAHCDHIHVAK